jgi:hypothetical protein
MCQSVIQGQKAMTNCEYPILGYFRILDDNLKPLTNLHELTIGYDDEDKTDEMYAPGTVSLTGNLSLLSGKLTKSPSKPDFEVIGTPDIPSDVRKLAFTTATLSVGATCNKTFSIVTNQYENKTYKIEGRFLEAYREEQGVNYKVVGTLIVFQDERKIFRSKFKLVRYRE